MHHRANSMTKSVVNTLKPGKGNIYTTLKFYLLYAILKGNRNIQSAYYNILLGLIGGQYNHYQY